MISTLLFQESENPTRHSGIPHVVSHQGWDETAKWGAAGARGGTKTSGVSPRFLLKRLNASAMSGFLS